jgi:hypothetical protein
LIVDQIEWELSIVFLLLSCINLFFTQPLLPKDLSFFFSLFPSSPFVSLKLRHPPPAPVKSPKTTMSAKQSRWGAPLQTAASSTPAPTMTSSSSSSSVPAAAAVPTQQQHHQSEITSKNHPHTTPSYENNDNISQQQQQQGRGYKMNINHNGMIYLHNNKLGFSCSNIQLKNNFSLSYILFSHIFKKITIEQGHLLLEMATVQ